MIMGAGIGMLIVETIATIRRLFFVQGKPIKAICRELGLSRKVVRKVLRSKATKFRAPRQRCKRPSTRKLFIDHTGEGWCVARRISSAARTLRGAP
jgi:hypothetical protein